MATLNADSLIRLDIGGVRVNELARQFGTPTYIYDESVILQRIDELRAFDCIRYAQKACSNIAILDVVRRQGVLVDAVSAGEIFRAQKAGYMLHGDPPPIVYTADVFDHEALRACADLGISVNVGSPDMIDQLGALAPGRELTLRVNPGFGHGHSQKTNTGGEQSKHGIWHGDIDDCLRRADRCGLSVTGVHMHIGSGTDLEHLAHVCGAMESVVRQVGRSVTTISTGGGLPIPYETSDERVDLQRYYALWNDVRQRLVNDFGHPIRLEIEPGRYLVAESGYLIAEIRAVKQMGKNLFYLLDAGFNNLARPILYGAYHPMAVSPASGRRNSDLVHPVVVGGPLCESGDIFTQEEGGFVASRPLPAAGVGDYVVIECAGAYGFVMSSNYNSRPMAAEVLIRDSRPHLIRARQTLDDLIAGEAVPGD